MFGRDIRRSLLYVVPAIIILCTIISTYRLSPDEIRLNRWMQPADGKIDVSQGKENAGLAHEEEAEVPLSFGKPEAAGDAPKSYPTGNKSAPLDIQTSHQEIFSLSTSDGKYYSIDFAGKHNGMNPNIIPHPTLENTWIVVAQMVRGESEQTVHFTELVCNAAFQGNILRCLQPPNALPVVPTKGGKCEGDIAYFTSNVGPHDARVVYGPDTPYIIYGSNSQFTCFGQFIQDFRELIDWQGREAGSQSFLEGTEMQRPLPWNAIEKNWFPFWDPFGNMYIHYGVSPKRTFAQINSDGTVGLDLSIGTEAEDAKCIAKYYPPILNSLESIHQASNSLKITMCKRTDAICIADESNTFIFTIWQHKTFYNFHGVYEPYLMLFQEHAPFAMHAVSKKPLWFHGRQQQMDKDTSDMFYVTSIAWKRPGVTYHGYLDDELFIGFGIEDRESGAIDVTAEELMSGLGLCTEA